MRILAVPLVVSAALGLGCTTGIMPASAEEKAASSSWSLSPNSGPATGGTKVTLTPPKFDEFTQVSAGGKHSLAIGSNGSTYSWGYGKKLGTGDPHQRNSNAPVKVAAPAGVSFTQISAGGKHSLAIGSDGNTYSWGYNDSGQLGDGTKAMKRFAPVMVKAPAGVSFTQVSAGGEHSLAIGSDGHTYAWGFGWKLGTGDPHQKNSNTPVMVKAPDGVRFTQISAGGEHSLAIGSDGHTYAWGCADWGQLGTGSLKPYIASTPVMVNAPAGVSFTQVSAGYKHSLAIGSDGHTYAWGSNLDGKLGINSTKLKYPSPVLVNAPAGVSFTQVSAGGKHSLGIGNNGRTYAWGFGWKLGTGDTKSSRVPVMVNAPAGVSFTQVSAGGEHSLAIGNNGRTYAWGVDVDGQLGTNVKKVKELSPTEVSTDNISKDSTVNVTSVKFAGIESTTLPERQTNGTWLVTAPANTAGPADVSVEWELNGVSQPAAHLSYDYTPIKYTVTFNPENGTPSTQQQVERGSTVVRPADPTPLPGYEFDGWYLNGVPYDFGLPVTSDLNLVAHWIALPQLKEPNQPNNGQLNSTEIGKPVNAR